MQKKVFKPRQDPRFKRHENFIANLLTHKSEYGYYALHSFAVPQVNIPDERLQDTFLNTSRIYSASLTAASPPDTHPDGYSRRYETKEASGERITSQVATCYFDAHIVTDGYIDVFCEGADGFNPNWFIYMIQRHLQLTKEVFDGFTEAIVCAVILENIERFKWEIYRSGHVWEKKPYAGYHGDIVLSVDLSAIHGRDKWNIKMTTAEDLMVRIARIFGMNKLPQPYWDKAEELDYPHGIPGR